MDRGELRGDREVSRGEREVAVGFKGLSHERGKSAMRSGPRRGPSSRFWLWAKK